VAWLLFRAQHSRNTWQFLERVRIRVWRKKVLSGSFHEAIILELVR
jgi:hypothetical protein